VDPVDDIEVLVPAAGQSARMGAWKPLLPFADSTIVETVVANALAACARVILVVGRRGEELAARFAGQPRVRIVRNPDWQRGMFSSLQAGMRRVTTPWFFVTLGDMPWIGPEVYAALRGHPGEADVIFPVYAGRRGHPVLIGRKLKEAALRADPVNSGMQSLAAGMNVLEMPWTDDSIHRDVDLPEDLTC
jgi:molybdenum cofactor cytidylyltransferase